MQQLKQYDKVTHLKYGHGRIIQFFTETKVAVLFEQKHLTRSGDGYATVLLEELSPYKEESC